MYGNGNTGFYNSEQVLGYFDRTGNGCGYGECCGDVNGDGNSYNDRYGNSNGNGSGKGL